MELVTFEKIAEICRSLPGVRSEKKWGDLCFLVGEKIFCMIGADGSVSLKIALEGRQWTKVEEPGRFCLEDWNQFIVESLALVRG